MPLIPPLRKVVTIGPRVEYYVHGDTSRPVMLEKLSCGHEGHLVECKKPRPERRRCLLCLHTKRKLRLVKGP